ncbi:putative RNA-directed DNA polymerase from transposon BS [Trichonephila clavipes]|nr:putative RNA-directed DNA polymerase from transposon BS [Trichonephila clavipes]
MIDHLGLSGTQRFLDIINCSWAASSKLKESDLLRNVAERMKSYSDLTNLERDINLVLEDIRNFTLDHKLTFNPTKSMARKRINILRYICGRDWGADAGTLKNTYISLIRPILEYGVQVYCSATITNLQKLEKVQAARITTGLKNTCPRDIVLFEVDLQPLSLRRHACLTKYYNKLRSLESQNRTSAYFKD